MTDRRHRRPLPLGGEDGLPFSKGLLARALAATGISNDRAYELALSAEADITQSGRESISFERLGELAREKLGEEDGATTMRRLHRFQDLYDLDLPIILLVGGATGTGKSTVATDVAYRLGITRVTSTDFVRQTMRAFFSQEFMPAIHHSSFEAGRRPEWHRPRHLRGRVLRGSRRDRPARRVDRVRLERRGLGRGRRRDPPGVAHQSRPRTREIELTSYAELVLAPPAADLAHPAFSNLFVQTEFVPELEALLATRRPRAREEPAVWAAHVGRGGRDRSASSSTRRTAPGFSAAAGRSARPSRDRRAAALEHRRCRCSTRSSAFARVRIGPGDDGARRLRDARRPLA